MTTHAPATLAEVRDPESGESYPRHLLTRGGSALVLFAAAWWGKQDAYWVGASGMTATCIDVDGARLAEMEKIYPDAWEFVEANVYTYAPEATRKWDIVSVDCPSGHFDQCADLVPIWCALADRAVILGTGAFTALVAPDGWRITEERKRSNYMGGVFWSVMEPE